MYNVQEIEENINLCDGFNGRFLYDEEIKTAYFACCHGGISCLHRAATAGD